MLRIRNLLQLSLKSRESLSGRWWVGGAWLGLFLRFRLTIATQSPAAKFLGDCPRPSSCFLCHSSRTRANVNQRRALLNALDCHLTQQMLLALFRRQTKHLGKPTANT